MSARASSRRGAAPRTPPRLASGKAARPKSGLLRRVVRIALYGAIGFIIGSIVLVALYRVLPPPGTPLMLIRLVEEYGIDKSWRPLDEISPHLIRAAMAGEDARSAGTAASIGARSPQPGIAIATVMAIATAPEVNTWYIEGSAANSENVGAACGMSCEATSRPRSPSTPQFRTLALAIFGIPEESTPLVASI